VVHLVERVRGWLGALGPRHGRLVAVTHPGVIRAAIVVALDAPPKAFWRIDVGPISRTVMHLRGGSWTLRCTA
jgi:broad specificity phosphatase PhoE